MKVGRHQIWPAGRCKNNSESFDWLGTSGKNLKWLRKSVHAEPFDGAQDKLVEALLGSFSTACWSRHSRMLVSRVQVFLDARLKHAWTTARQFT
jgi:hypothetical protein